MPALEEEQDATGLRVTRMRLDQEVWQKHPAPILSLGRHLGWG